MLHWPLLLRCRSGLLCLERWARSYCAGCSEPMARHLLMWVVVVHLHAVKKEALCAVAMVRLRATVPLAGTCRWWLLCLSVKVSRLLVMLDRHRAKVVLWLVPALRQVQRCCVVVSCEVVRRFLLPCEAGSAPKDAETRCGEVNQLCGRYSWHQRGSFHLERA